MWFFFVQFYDAGHITKKVTCTFKIYVVSLHLIMVIHIIHLFVTIKALLKMCACNVINQCLILTKSEKHINDLFQKVGGLHTPTSNTPLMNIYGPCLIWISGVSAQHWKVTMADFDICAVRGSTVVMSCSFIHPPGLNVTQVYWGINARKNVPLPDLLYNPQYIDRVKYSTKRKNCTLTLSDVRVTDTAFYYARIKTTTGDNWQSSNVNLKVTGKGNRCNRVKGSLTHTHTQTSLCEICIEITCRYFVTISIQKVMFTLIHNSLKVWNVLLELNNL